MNILNNLFLLNKKSKKNKDFSPGLVDQYIEIAKLVKEARIQKNLTIKELSYISKIPERIIISIENNNKKNRPEYPFIRSILIKLEECLVLKKNTLLKLAVRKNLLLSLIKDEKLEFTDAKKLLVLIRDTFSPLNIAKSAVQNIISTV